VCQEVEVHTFPGGHLTGMRLPVVKDTARVFLECLARDVARDAQRASMRLDEGRPVTTEITV
jgi:hypothetical protein